MNCLCVIKLLRFCRFYVFSVLCSSSCLLNVNCSMKLLVCFVDCFEVVLALVSANGFHFADQFGLER